MTTRIGQQHSSGAYTLKRIGLRQVALYVGAVLVNRSITQAAAFAYGFTDSAEFQAVFVGV